MTRQQFLSLGAALHSGLPWLQGRARGPRKRRVPVIAVSQGFQQDSIWHAIPCVARCGKSSSWWDTFLRTETQLLTKKKLPANPKNLDTFDGVLFYTTGELAMDDGRTQGRLSFVREDGKGIFGAHSATDTFFDWPEYGEMLGGHFDQHPWNQFPARLTVEDRDFPAMRHVLAQFTRHDEIYRWKNWDRQKVRIRLRLEATLVDLKHQGGRRTDRNLRSPGLEHTA